MTTIGVGEEEQVLEKKPLAEIINDDLKLLSKKGRFLNSYWKGIRDTNEQYAQAEKEGVNPTTYTTGNLVWGLGHQALYSAALLVSTTVPQTDIWPVEFLRGMVNFTLYYNLVSNAASIVYRTNKLRDGIPTPTYGGQVGMATISLKFKDYIKDSFSKKNSLIS